MTCDCGDVPKIKASFIKCISRGGLLSSSPDMVRIALISYLIITKICESDEYQKCFYQRDFAVKLSQSVLEAEYFSFLSWGKCERKNDSRTVANRACWICSNILLNNNYFKRYDRLTCDKLSKKRKLHILTWYEKCQHSFRVLTSATSRWMLWLHRLRACTIIAMWHWYQWICANLSYARVHCLVQIK